MPTFDGSSIFGLAVQVITADNPIERQNNAFPGVNGVESLTLGTRGRFSTVQGILNGANAGALAAVENTFRSYNDGGAYTFVDSYGTSWDNVQLDSFEPQGKILQDSTRGYYRRYTARFKHLS